MGAVENVRMRRQISKPSHQGDPLVEHHQRGRLARCEFDGALAIGGSDSFIAFTLRNNSQRLHIFGFVVGNEQAGIDLRPGLSLLMTGGPHLSLL